MNRADGRRTAATALNLQEIRLYVVTAKGAFSYRHAEHELIKLTDKNLMPLVAMQQDFVMTAPLALVYVGDLAKLPGERARDGCGLRRELPFRTHFSIVQRRTSHACPGRR